VPSRDLHAICRPDARVDADQLRMNMHVLTIAEVDRAAGLLLAGAVGDSLAAGAGTGAEAMVCGPWTQITSVAMDIALASAPWEERFASEVPGSGWRRVVRDAIDAGRLAPGGALLQCGAVTLPYLDDEAALAEEAVALSTSTNDDPEVTEACLLLSLTMRHAVRTGRLDIRHGLARLEQSSAVAWTLRIEEAEAGPVADFTDGANPVRILQGAWSAISRTPVPEDQPRAGVFRAQHLQLALEAAARGGSPGIAVVAGGLLGAAYGASAVPAAWRRRLHGPTGLRTGDLVVIATAAATQAPPFDGDYSLAGDLSALGKHPYDDQVWIGGYKALRNPPAGVDAVVSLCPIGADDVPPDVELIEVRLVDLPDPAANPNLGFVLHDTADLLQALRAEGRTVLLHSVSAKSRVPVVACAYGLRLHTVPTTLVIAEVEAVLFGARMNTAFRDALEALAPNPEPKPRDRPRPGLSRSSARNYKTRGDWPEGRSPRSF
jgi:hypothetical protein